METIPLEHEIPSPRRQHPVGTGVPSAFKKMVEVDGLIGMIADAVLGREVLLALTKSIIVIAS